MIALISHKKAQNVLAQIQMGTMFCVFVYCAVAHRPKLATIRS
jgi:hypothetical protein